jgi:hypothetical protein
MLKKNLRDMMKDGHLDEQEIAQLRIEAKRLHITIEELNALLEQVHNDRLHAQSRSVLPLHLIAEKPAQAVEHYKMLLSQINQLALMTDAAKFEQAAQASQNLSPKELALWQQFKANS